MSKLKDIRRSVKKILLNEPYTAVGQQVFNAEVRIFNNGDLPLINIFTTDERIDEGAGYNSRHHQTRICDLEIYTAVAPPIKENRLDADDEILTLADTLDDLVKEIETRLDADRQLGGVVTWTEWQSTSYEYSPDAHTPHAAAMLLYQVKFVNT